jgi:hypothetical protein
MQKLPTALFAFLVLAGSAHAADGPGADSSSATAAFAIPVTKTATTKALSGWEPINDRKAFYHAAFVDAYQAHGHHDPAWDDLAVKYLDMCARDRSTYENRYRYLPDRKAVGEAVMAAGCDDPLVCYMRARDLDDFDHPANGSNPRWGTDAEQAAMYAKVYPGIRDRGYDGFVRFMAGNQCIFQKGHIDEALRQQMMPGEVAARLDWLRDPAVIQHPDVISAWMRAPSQVKGDDETRTAYWQAFAQTPAAWPDPESRWMAELMNGIAHTYLSHGFEPMLQTDGAIPATDLDPVVDHDEVKKAVACLQEARKLHPADGQADDWLIAVAAMDPAAVQDVPGLLGASLTLDAGDINGLTWYGWWLDIRHPGNVAANAEYIDACSRQNIFGTGMFDLQITRAWDFAGRSPDQADALLHRPDVYAALAEAEYWRVRPRWIHPDEYHARLAAWSALLWKMGYMAEARDVASAVDDRFMTMNIQMFMPVSLEDFRAAIAADANVRLLDQARASGADATAAVAALQKAAASDQPFLLDAYARELAWVGRKSASFALTDRTIARFGRQARDAMLFLDALQPPASAQDIETGFAHLQAHPDQIFVTPYSADITSRVRMAGVQDRYLALIQPWMYGNNFTFDLNTTWVLLDTIDGAPKAAELLHRMTGQKGLVNERWLAHDLAVQTLGARLSHRPDLEPGADELRAQVGQPHDLDTGDALMAFLAGDADRAATLAQAQTVGKNADEIYYYLALDDLVHGDREQARADLKHLLAHPTWEEVGEANCILAHFDSPLLSATAATTAPPQVTRTPIPPARPGPAPATPDAPAAKPSDF